MNALRRVAKAPGLIAGVWLLEVILAGVFGFVLHAGAIAATEPHSALPDGHHLFHLAELLETDRSLLVLAGGGAITAALVAGLAWTVASPFVIARLAGRPLGEVGSIGLRSLPAVAVQTLWHAGMRVLVFFATVMIIGAAPGVVKVLLLVAAGGASALALDVVRVQVSLHGASPFHIRSAFFAFVRTFKNLRFLASGIGIYALQVVAAAAIGVGGLHSIGEGSVLWGLRLGALIAVFAGLWRVALAVELGAVPLQRLDPPESDTDTDDQD